MYSRNDGNINKTDLLELCPAVLYQLSKKQCHAQEKKVAEDEEDTRKEKPARGMPFARSKFYICSYRQKPSEKTQKNLFFQVLAKYAILQLDSTSCVHIQKFSP